MFEPDRMRQIVKIDGVTIPPLSLFIVTLAAGIVDIVVALERARGAGDGEDVDDAALELMATFYGLNAFTEARFATPAPNWLAVNAPSLMPLLLRAEIRPESLPDERALRMVNRGNVIAAKIDQAWAEVAAS